MVKLGIICSQRSSNIERLCYPTTASGSPEYSGWYFSQKDVTVQGGYGALFAVMVPILLSAVEIAVKVGTESVIGQGAEV
jgi:hypothetical protein